MIIYTIPIFIIIYIFWLLNIFNLVHIKSLNTNEYYYVNQLPDKQNASDLLGELHNKLKYLVNNLDETNPYFKRLKNRFDGVQFMENPELRPHPTMTSYSVNKGEKIVFCLRDPIDLKLHDINTIMYVALHEISHIACPEIGHPPLFTHIFASILKEAIRLGIYKDVNYLKHPANYCGITIEERII
jgi:hypothetical protein